MLLRVWTEYGWKYSADVPIFDAPSGLLGPFQSISVLSMLPIVSGSGGGSAARL